MLNIIVCDDNNEFRNDIVEHLKTIITCEYNLFIFDDYTNDFVALSNKKMNNRIYILDIETPSANGIDMAKRIRAHDIKSYIIFITAYHNKYQQEILKSLLMFLGFIEKKEYKIELNELMNYAIDHIEDNNIIQYVFKNVRYRIFINDILYVETDSVTQHILITTEYNVFSYGRSSLNDFLNHLNKYFIKSSNSCIVNTSRIMVFNKKDRKIVFDNKMSLYNISHNFAKSVQDAIKKHHNSVSFKRR